MTAIEKAQVTGRRLTLRLRGTNTPSSARVNALAEADRAAAQKVPDAEMPEFSLEQLWQRGVDAFVSAGSVPADADEAEGWYWAENAAVLDPAGPNRSFLRTLPSAYRSPMRRPDPVELEYAFAELLIAVPMGYYAIRWLFALVSGT